MTAVYKKEIRGFFTSMVGYVFLAFLLAVSGIYFTAYHLQAMYPKFSYTLQAVVFVFLIIVPILSMRVLAEERRQKTDQLLLTAPVSVEAIVIGKYLALLSVLAAAVVILSVYPLILTQFGAISLTEAYTALFGFFLMGACYLAIGLYISSVTESQMIAAVLIFLVLFLCYVSEGIGSFFPETASASYLTLAVVVIVAAVVLYQMIHQWLITALAAVIGETLLLVVYLTKASVYEGLIQKLFGVFDLNSRFSEFCSGIFDLTGIVYDVSFLVIFLFLTVQSIQKRRWGERRLKNGSYSVTMTAVVVAAATAVNLIVSECPSQYTKLDISEQQLSSLTDQSKELLEQLEEDVTLYYLVQDSSKDTYISHLLERYDGYSHIHVEEIDPVISPNFASQYTEETLADNSIIVSCGESSRVIDYSSMYQSEFNYNYYTYETTGFDGEGQITSAIAAVSSGELPKLYTLTGHGELEINSVYAQAIEKENLETSSLNLMTAERVPEDADGLLIASPTSDLSDAETEKILAYLKTGGKAVIVADYTETELPNLERILAYYGMALEKGVVLEKDSNYYIQRPYYLVPEISSTEISSDMTGGNNYVFLAAAQGIQTTETLRDTLNITSVLTTSDSAYLKKDVAGMTTYEKEEGDSDGPFNLGMVATETVELTEELQEEVESAVEAAEKNEDLTSLKLSDSIETANAEESAKMETGANEETESLIETEAKDSDAEAEENFESADTERAETEENTETKLAVFTSSAILDASADQMVSGGNSKLFLNTLSWICGHTSTISIPAKSLSVDYLTVTAAGSNFWSILVIGIIPGTILIAGLAVWLKRRRQ